MEELNNFDLVKVFNRKPREYDLIFDINGKKKKYVAFVKMTEPFFGLDFSSELIFILRDYRTDAQKLVKTVRNLYEGKKVDFPLSLLIEERISELQTV
jgi:hypothetical protein